MNIIINKCFGKINVTEEMDFFKTIEVEINGVEFFIDFFIDGHDYTDLPVIEEFWDNIELIDIKCREYILEELLYDEEIISASLEDYFEHFKIEDDGDETKQEYSEKLRITAITSNVSNGRFGYCVDYVLFDEAEQFGGTLRVYLDDSSRIIKVTYES